MCRRGLRLVPEGGMTRVLLFLALLQRTADAGIRHKRNSPSMDAEPRHG